MPYEAPESVNAHLRELSRELDSDLMRTQLVVALDPMSRIRDGDKARLWFDPARIHLFDPRTGANLTRELDRAALLAAASSAPATATAGGATALA